MFLLYTVKNLLLEQAATFEPHKYEFRYADDEEFRSYEFRNILTRYLTIHNMWELEMLLDDDITTFR